MGFQKAIALARSAQAALRNLQFAPTQKTYADFAAGYVSLTSREQTPENASPNCLDMEVTWNNRIRPAPGTTLVEVMEHAVSRVVVHASLDMTAELLMFAPPYLGVKNTGATVWTDMALGSTDFAYVNFGGTLIFTDGVKVYKREINEAPVSTKKIPVGRAYAAFAGRFWAGNCVIDGDMQPMGVAWSDTTSDPESWDPDQGGGYELLINDLASGDEVVALRPMGLDFIAIMCRRSIWIGRRTGLEGRPADLQPRVSGVGALNEKLCVLSRFGVYFLTHSGVHLFDGNSAVVVSDQINADILPIDLNNLDKYGMFFNPQLKRLYFFTPTDSWTLEVEKNRWLRRSLIAKDAAAFATQFPALTWGDLVGTWGDQNVRWKDYRPEEGQDVAQLFLSTDGLKLHNEDYASRMAFGLPMNPYWDTPLTQQEFLDRLLTIKGITLEYEGNGRVAIWTPDELSAWQRRLVVTLVDRVLPDFVARGLTTTGHGVGARVQILAGSPEISKIQLVARTRGRRVD